VVAEARKYSALAIDTSVELTKDSHTDSTRFNAATALQTWAMRQSDTPLDPGRGEVLALLQRGVVRPVGATVRFTMFGAPS
jgi:hypothetical protein